MDMNLVILTGRLTRDPEIRYTANGKAVAKFSIASNGKSKDQVEYTDVVVWDKAGEACNTFLSKGSQVAVNGRKQTRSYEGKDGNKHRATEVVASNVQFLSTKKNGAPAAATAEETGDLSEILF